MNHATKGGQNVLKGKMDLYTEYAKDRIGQSNSPLFNYTMHGG